MKPICSILFLWICFAVTLSAQTGRSDRNSISIIRLDYPDTYREDINRVFDHLQPDARYDINTIPTQQIRVQGKRIYTNKDGEYEAPDRTEQIQEYLNGKNIGLEIISYLFNRNPQTGVMSLERLFKRGEYNASDENVRESLATKRGTDQLKEAGFNLINNSYVLVFDFINIRYKYQKGSSSDDGDFYWLATPAAYMFKIEWSETLQNELFNSWIDSETPIQERISKQKAYGNIHIPMRFICRTVDNNRSLSTGIEEQNRKVANGGKRKYKKEELNQRSFNTLILQAADYLGEEIESKYQAFQITNSIYATHPIRSKVGKKENVRVNDRYFVYEQVLQEDGSTKLSRRGVIRATSHIIDNRSVATGNSGTSEFYQIAGRPLEEGMTIREKQSLYINLDLGYRYGKLEGGYAGISTNLYATRATNHNAMLGFTAWKEAITVTLDYGFGLRCNNFDIYPYVGAGLDSFWKDKEYPDYDDSKAWLAQGGVRFNLNLYYPVQLFGAIEYNYPFSKNDAYKEMQALKDRNIQGVNAYGGLRICF